MTAVDYNRRAQQHRPTDQSTLRAAALELRNRGLTERDIGQALRLDPTGIRRLLREVPR